MIKISWSAPKTFSLNEVLTYTDMNTYLRDNTLYLKENYLLANQYQNTTPTNTDVTNQRAEQGIRDLTFTTLAYGSVAVTFDDAYTAAPRVYGAQYNDILGNFVFEARSVATTGFTLFAMDVLNATRTGSQEISWLAIGA